MIKKWWPAVLLLLFLPGAYAAVIYGTIYDIDLDPAANSIIKISTVPVQNFVAKDGAYSFDVSPGFYYLSASYDYRGKSYSAEQNLTVSSDGKYLVDLIVFPDLAEEGNLLDQEIDPDSRTQIAGNAVSRSPLLIPILVACIIIAITAIVVYFVFLKNRKRSVNQDLGNDLAHDVLDFIRSEHGRTTQKDIRNKFPYSEAKISLVITELEHKGVVRKIQKGRANVIILNR
jgi:uncharacterized membrane protein